MRYERNDGNQEACVNAIIESFRHGDWRKVLNNESVGGNAGSNQVAINAVVDKSTGEVRAFGNPQEVNPDILRDSANTEATFIYNMGNAVQVMLGNAHVLEPGRFIRIRAAGCSELAAGNLTRALKSFNAEHAVDQQQYHAQLQKKRNV